MMILLMLVMDRDQQVVLSLSLSLSLSLYIYISFSHSLSLTHTHTHTHTYNLLFVSMPCPLSEGDSSTESEGALTPAADKCYNVFRKQRIASSSSTVHYLGDQDNANIATSITMSPLNVSQVHPACYSTTIVRTLGVERGDMEFEDLDSLNHEALDAGDHITLIPNPSSQP